MTDRDTSFRNWESLAGALVLLPFFLILAYLVFGLVCAILFTPAGLIFLGLAGLGAICQRGGW